MSETTVKGQEQHNSTEEHYIYIKSQCHSKDSWQFTWRLKKCATVDSKWLKQQRHQTFKTKRAAATFLNKLKGINFGVQLINSKDIQKRDTHPCLTIKVPKSMYFLLKVGEFHRAWGKCMNNWTLVEIRQSFAWFVTTVWVVHETRISNDRASIETRYL